MKYSKLIIVVMFFNFVIAFVLIFVGHQTRNLEKFNSNLTQKIEKKNHEININQIEFALHNDNEYLKKLYFLYQSDLEKKELSKIIRLSEFVNINKKKILKVGFK